MKLRDGVQVADVVSCNELKIQVLSDLHIEGMEFTVEKAGDVLVLAGDIFSGRAVPIWRKFIDETMELGFKAVLFVIGNHEGYGWTFEEARKLLRETEKVHDRFHFLDRGIVTIEGIRFLGCPLWSDPGLMAQTHAKLYLADYKQVRDWTIEDHIREHRADLAWLADHVRKHDVVITHFPPTRLGVDQDKFGGDILNEWFTNDIDTLVRMWEAGLWISGHTHHTWYQYEGRTLLVGNCRGYTRRHHGTGQLIPEVPGFDPIKTIDYRVYNDADQSAGGVAD